MPLDSRLPRLAVLIDGDNISARIADGLFAEVATLGHAAVRRIYGDFSTGRLRPWADILSRHSIIPQQQFASAASKNASDISLVIDAMDLLHGGRIDGFCLVSSDSDFTRLAARIREQGHDVFGFGEAKTPESFRRACHRFFLTESPLTQTPGGAALPRLPAARPLLTAEAAVPLIMKAVLEAQSGDGWAPLSDVGSTLTRMFPGFAAASYGSGSLSKLAIKTGTFHLERRAGGILQIRIKQIRPVASALG